MSKSVRENMTAGGWPVDAVLGSIKAEIQTEDDHLLSHGYLVSLASEHEDAIRNNRRNIRTLQENDQYLDDKIEALEKKAFIAIAIVGITTITIALAKDKITEKVNSFKEKRKAKTE